MTKRRKRTTEEALALLEDQLREILETFGLHMLWTADLKISPKSKMENPDGMAEVAWPSGYRHATIRVNEGTATMAPVRDLHQMLKHEVGHMILAPIHDTIQRYVGETSLVREAVADSEEQVVEYLANILPD